MLFWRKMLPTRYILYDSHNVVSIHVLPSLIFSLRGSLVLSHPVQFRTCTSLFLRFELFSSKIGSKLGELSLKVLVGVVVISLSVGLLFCQLIGFGTER